MISELKWMKMESEFLPTEDDVKKTEDKLNFKFPKDFIEIMMENDGASPSIRTFDVDNDEDCVNNLLSFDEESIQSILYAYDVICNRGNKNIYPIARDPFGNYICYKKTASGDTQVVFWNHENPEKIVKLCDSFSDFLNLLYE